MMFYKHSDINKSLNNINISLKRMEKRDISYNDIYLLRLISREILYIEKLVEIPIRTIVTLVNIIKEWNKKFGDIK